VLEWGPIANYGDRTNRLVRLVNESLKSDGDLAPSSVNARINRKFSASTSMPITICVMQRVWWPQVSRRDQGGIPPGI